MQNPLAHGAHALIGRSESLEAPVPPTQTSTTVHTGRGGHQGGLVWLALFVVVAVMLVQLPPMVARQDSIIHAYSALVEVDALARQRYVEPIHAGQLVDGAIRGMLLELDPYSGYIAPEELPAFERRQRGVFSGVGVELGAVDGETTVIAPIDGSPAARAGVLPGDVLLSIDGVDITHRSVFDVEEMLAGPANTAVELVLRHAHAEVPRTLRLVREAVRRPSVRGFRHDGPGTWDFLIDRQCGIGYIRISSFHDRTLREFDAAVAAVRAEGGRALILDLRFNPGGLMDPAVRIVDRFVETGAVLTTVNRRRAVDVYPAHPETTTWTAPVVVLINGGSASSAEIVAGSLQAHGRAVVVGERSFGKGSVQHLLHLTEHKAAVKLTVAYYRLPNGRLIHRSENQSSELWGVLPDVELTLTREEHAAIQDSRRCVDLAPPTAADRRGGAHAESKCPELLVDRQLAEALNAAAQTLDTHPDKAEPGKMPGS